MKSHPPVFGLLTDFGFDFAVASMKAVILKSVPDAQIVDIDHSLTKFSILSAAFILDKTHQFFPVHTYFIAVVDPGVGTKRAPLFVQTPNYSFVGPNNGVFSALLTRYPMHGLSH